MNHRNIPFAACIAASVLSASAAQAAIIVSEVAPYASGNTVYAADWFELTNTGASAVTISGWKFDDNSNAFGSAVALRGVASIAAGQSMVFIEGLADGSTDAALRAAFGAAWFGANVPATLVIGNYGGAGIGLSTAGDAVNIFDGAGALVTRIDFGASTTGRSFDNRAGLDNATVTSLSTAGIGGAVVSFNGAEIGSPGAVSAVPDAPSALLLLAGIGALGWATRRR